MVPATGRVPLPRDRDDALDVLFRVYHRQLLGFAVLLIGDRAAAEDVVQDAYVNLYQRWLRIADPQAAYAYLRTSVLNGSRNYFRRLRSHERTAASIAPDAPSAEVAAFEQAEHDQVLELLNHLPLRQRQVLVLRYYLDQTEVEIADELAISRGSVKQHASRGLAALVAHLGALS